MEELPGGGVKLWVHVADPTRWVEPGARAAARRRPLCAARRRIHTRTPPLPRPRCPLLAHAPRAAPPPCPHTPAGSELDLEARARGRTLYLPFGSIPMYPRALAEGPFSLGSSAGGGAPCCALSVGVTLAPDGGLDGWEVTPSLVRVTAALTYDEADADLALGPGGCAHAPLQALYEAARARKGWRLAGGAIEIDTPEARTRASGVGGGVAPAAGLQPLHSLQRHAQSAGAGPPPPAWRRAFSTVWTRADR